MADAVKIGSSRLAIIAAVLAFFAVTGMSALSGWHAASFHDDVKTVLVDHADHHDDRHDGEQQGVDIHLSTHAFMHGLSLPLQLVQVQMPALSRQLWGAGISLVLTGVAPEALLRPPRG